MIITDENAVIQALANVRLESIPVSLELQAQLNAPASERLTTDQLLAMLRARSTRSSTFKK
jgi:hypothetical protein